MILNRIHLFWCKWKWLQVERIGNSKQTPWGWDEFLTSSSGTCSHSTALCSSIGICQRTPELPALPLAPRSLCRWEKLHNEHMWRMLGSLQHHPAWPVWWWLNDCLRRIILCGWHKPPRARQWFPDCCYLAGWNPQTLCCCSEPWFLLV